MTIRAGANGDIREASGSSLGGAAIGDLSDPGGVIKLEVPLLVESGIAHRRRRWRRCDARRDWIVNIKVLSATLFSFTRNTATMPAEDRIPIHVECKSIITQQVLARVRTLLMSIDHNRAPHTSARRVQMHNLRP